MKLRNIVYSAIAALLLNSCEENAVFVDNSMDDEKTLFTFNIDLGEELGTRAMTEGAQIRNLYVAVFDAEGYKLSEYVQAELEGATTYADESEYKSNNVLYKYSVKLTVSNNKRILHFIANAPKNISYGSENEVIGSLFTKYDNNDSDSFKESYWQRIEVDCIPSKDDETKYQEVAETLDKIKLVRNYSKITLQKKAYNSATDEAKFQYFTIEGMWMVNAPDRGTVAPYNRNTEQFMSNYLEYSKVADLEDETGNITGRFSGESISKGNYQGFMLATTEFIVPEDFIEDPSNSGYNMIQSASGEPYTTISYVYEREKALISPMYLIVKAKYESNGDGDYDDPGEGVCYYKIALQDSKGEFYSMLRNFNYKIEIQSVAKKGEPTAKKALEGAPSGDISVNVEYQDITSISDGEARMTVSNTTLVLVGDVGDVIEYDDLWYKYEPEAGTIANETYPTNNPGVVIDYDSEHGAGGVVINTHSLATSDVGGLRYITIKTEPVSSVRKTQTISITGSYLDGSILKTITRKINLVLRERLTMDLICGPNTDSNKHGHIKNAVGEPVTVSIGIEQDLPSSMFPLNFKIETAKQTLSPSGDVLPVESGESTIEGVDHPSFWYVRTVSWEEYCEASIVDGKKYFNAGFKTIVSDSNPETIYVSQDYFKQTSVQLKKGDLKSFTSTAFSKTVAQVGESVTFTYAMSALPDATGTPATRKVRLAISGLEPTLIPDVLTYVESKDGCDIYEMTVTSATGNTVTLKPYVSGQASITLSADQFTPITSTMVVKNPTDNKYAIEAKSLTLYRVNNSNALPEGTKITVYFEDPAMTNAKPVQTFTVDADGQNLAFDIYNATATADDKVYLSFVLDDGTYYAQTTLDVMNSATTGSPLSIISQPDDAISLFINYENGDPNAKDWIALTTSDYTGAGFPVRSQQYYLIGYVSLNNLNGVTIDGKGAAVTGIVRTFNGKKFYQYETTATSSKDASNIYDASLVFNGMTLTREVRVWTNPFYLGATALTSTDDIMAAQYGVAIYNKNKAKYLTATSNSNLGSTDSWTDAHNSDTWFQVTTGYRIKSKSRSRAIRYNSGFNMNGNGEDLTLNYDSTNKYWTITIYDGSNRGLAVDDSGNIVNNTTANNQWAFYPILKTTPVDPM